MDLINFDSLLSEKQREFTLETRSFLEKEILPAVKLAHREGIFPKDFETALAKKRWIGANLLGLDTIEYALLMRELERVDSGLRTFASVQGALVMFPIKAFGSEKLQDLYLDKLSNAEMIGSFALTEPDFGSDPGAMKTKAIKVEGGYEITGSKSWLTNGQVADIVIVWANLEGKICGFVLDTRQAGFKAIEIEGKFSMRMSKTSHMQFDKCFVPEDHLLEGAQGIKYALQCLNEARFGIIWGSIGAAEAVYEKALDYSKNRIGFQGKPIASHQLVQAKLVAMAQKISQAKLLAMHITKLKIDGELKPHHISLGKMNNCKIALECAREARDILGANGTLDDHDVIRHMINLETVNTYEGTEDIHRLILGKTITGENGFFS